MLWLLAVPAASFGAPPACSNSGVQVGGGACVCDQPFGGPDCVALAFAPPDEPGAGLIPRFGPPIGVAPQATWGGSPIHDPATGKYHLFFSWFKMMDNSTCPTIKWWYNSSVVAHAVSDTPGSNYRFVDLALPPRGIEYFDGSTTHNPTVTRLADGSYALYYIGLNCGNYSKAPDPNGPDRGQSECIKHQWIGAAHSTDLNGPWERLGDPVLTGVQGNWEGGMVANPAVVVLANGSILMAYRGLNDKGIGMAIAPKWDGPFTRLNGGGAVLGPASAQPTAVAEDMTMWRSKRGLQMIFHQEGRGSNVGAHAFSTDDGLSWTVAGDAYSLDVATKTHNISYFRRERPQMLKSTAGVPTHMFSGVAVSDGSQDGGTTRTIAIPFKALA